MIDYNTSKKRINFPSYYIYILTVTNTYQIFGNFWSNENLFLRKPIIIWFSKIYQIDSGVSFPKENSSNDANHVSLTHYHMVFGNRVSLTHFTTWFVISRFFQKSYLMFDFSKCIVCVFEFVVRCLNSVFRKKCNRT